MQKISQFLFVFVLTIVSHLGFADVVTKNKHIIIVDAGSSGSRAYVFRVEHKPHSSLLHLVELEETDHDRTLVGLDVYETEPKQAGPSLGMMFDSVTAKIKEDGGEPSKTPFYLYATAGMRLLKERNAVAVDQIYDSVRTTADKRFQVKATKTISGQWEGVYNWIGINYLLGTLNKPDKTIGALDMGGASTEITYMTNVGKTSSDIVPITLGDHQYSVFSHSFLGLGDDQVALKLQSVGYCYPEDTPGVNNAKFSYPLCSKETDALVSQNNVHSQLAKIPPHKKFMAISGYYYVADFFSAKDQPQPLTSMTRQIQHVCKNKYQSIRQDHLNLSERYLKTYCLQGVYQLSLLLDGYGFSEHISKEQLKIVKKLKTHDGTYKINWAVGAAIYHSMNQSNDSASSHVHAFV